MDEILGATLPETDEWEDVMEEEAPPPGADVVNYMGIPLGPASSDGSAAIDGLKLKPNERVILFQVDDVPYDYPIEKIAQTWLDDLRVAKALPQELLLPNAAAEPSVTASGPQKRGRNGRDLAQSVRCDYLKALGDEWSFSRTPSECEYVGGDKFLGRVWISKK